MLVKKIFGWILLIFGVTSIIWGIWNSYQIFTAKKPVPEIFVIEESLVGGEEPAEDTRVEMEQQIQQAIGQQLNQMFPPGFISKILNLSSWSIFMFILVMAGGKISVLGIRLLKNGNSSQS